MPVESFVKYIGDYRLHDSRLKEVKSNKNGVQVSLKSVQNEMIIVKFVGVKSISSNRPEGMILYAITEMKEQSPLRKFVFANWDDHDDASLEIIALDYIIQ